MFEELGLNVARQSRQRRQPAARQPLWLAGWRDAGCARRSCSTAPGLTIEPGPTIGRQGSKYGYGIPPRQLRYRGQARGSATTGRRAATRSRPAGEIEPRSRMRRDSA